MFGSWVDLKLVQSWDLDPIDLVLLSYLLLFPPSIVGVCRRLQFRDEIPQCLVTLRWMQKNKIKWCQLSIAPTRILLFDFISLRLLFLESYLLNVGPYCIICLISSLTPPVQMFVFSYWNYLIRTFLYTVFVHLMLLGGRSAA